MAKPSAEPSLVHVLTVYAFSFAGAALYTAMGLFAFVMVKERSLDQAFQAAAFGLMVGGVLGIGSVPWVLYFLLESKLTRSIPFVLAVTGSVALVTGPLGPVALITTSVANIAACYVSYRSHNAATWRRRRGVCVHCEYDLRGLKGARCPECGTLQRPVTITLDRSGSVIRDEIESES